MSMHDIENRLSDLERERYDKADKHELERLARRLDEIERRVRDLEMTDMENVQRTLGVMPQGYNASDVAGRFDQIEERIAAIEQSRGAG